MSRYIGAAAGGTLGFIAGDIPGAVAGAGFGYKYGQENLPKNKMVNGKRKRTSHIKIIGTRRPGAARTVRRTSKVKKTYHVNKVNRSKGSSRDDDRGVVVSAKRSKGLKPKGRKPVKVSAAFKRKVNKSLEGKKAIGHMREIVSRKCGFSIPDNLQEVNYLTDENASTHGFFSPVRVMDAASCLFNKKAAARNKQNTTNNFPHTITKVNVLSQYATMTLNNQTRRCKTITIYQASQKGKLQATTEPLGAWTAGLLLDAQNLPDGDTLGPNLSGVVKEFLGMKPTMNKAWNKEWNVEAKTIQLEAGQTFSFTIPGPSGVYDYQKMHDGNSGVISELHPWTKYVFYTVYNDLVVTNLGITGRFETIPPLITNAIVCEYTYNYKIEAPEITGFDTPGTFGATQSLNLIKDAYIYQNYSAAIGLGTVNRIDDGDPATVEAGV